MHTLTHVLAIDIGASSGRVMQGTWNLSNGTVSLKEIHRFPNEAVELCGTLYWDVLRLIHEIKHGIRAACRLLPPGEHIASLGFDTWGVDFGLLDAEGKLLGNPVHYRDSRTNGMIEKAGALLGKNVLFETSGIQDAWFNTVYQLMGALERNPEAFDQARCLLFMPDLFNYFLTGEKKAEHSIASTSQLTCAGRPAWSAELLDKLGLPGKLLPVIVEAGQILGPVLPHLALDLGLKPGTPVALVPSHDTESAALAVPARGDEGSFAFVSCGTWAVIGAELDAPILTERCRSAGFTNEAGYGGKNYLLRNLMGLWLLQECKRWWERDGTVLDHGELVELAEASPAWQYTIDINNSLFASPGDMPGRIASYCQTTGQKVPQSRGEMVRAIIEGLARGLKDSLLELEGLCGKNFNALWLVGGGSQNRLLCQITADLIGRPVYAGPSETTALGNAMSQFMSLGCVGTVAESRQAVSRSFGVRHYGSVQTTVAPQG